MSSIMCSNNDFFDKTCTLKVFLREWLMIHAPCWPHLGPGDEHSLRGRRVLVAPLPCLQYAGLQRAPVTKRQRPRRAPRPALVNGVQVYRGHLL